MPRPQFLYGSLDMLHATLLPHRLGGEVAVGPRPIPISINGLGIKRDNDTKILRNPLEDIPMREENSERFNTLSNLSTHLAIQRSSPIEIPSQGPTWNSHWAGITSALVPLTLIPAYRQAL